MYKFVIANGKKYVLSHHAIKRSESRNISLQDIKQAIENPNKNFQTVVHGEGYYLRGKNNIKLIFSLDKKVIVTVVRASREYSASKNRAKRNDKKKRLEIKKKYGNRTNNRRRGLR